MKNFVVNPHVVRMCDFYVQDIIREEVPFGFDVIYCLNLFVYLTDEGKDSALFNLTKNMVSGSLLIVDEPYSVPAPDFRGRPRYNARTEAQFGWKADLNELYESLHQRDFGLRKISTNPKHNVYEKG